MLQPGDYVAKAGAFITKAQEAEQRGEIGVAVDNYNQALSVFNVILQNKQNIYLSETITSYAANCLAKTQQLEEKLKSGVTSNRVQTSPHRDANASVHSQSSDGGGTVHHEESDLMMQQLSLTRIDPKVFKLTWDDVVGMVGVKQFLDDAITMPRDMPQLFTGNREAVRSVLLYGPPGTGKTFLGKALACVSRMPFYSVSSAELISKYVGDSEKMIKYLFEMVKGDKPCILFLDEVDALCGKREESSNNTKTVQQFLAQLDGMTTSMDGVLVLACTNLPWSLDEAMRRRLVHRLYIGLPTQTDRGAMLRYYIGKNRHCVTNDQLSELAAKTEYFSADDIKQLCKRAAMMPITLIRNATHFIMLENGDLIPCKANTKNSMPMRYEQIPDKNCILEPEVTYANILEALGQTKSTVDVKKLKEYEEWTKMYGSVY